MALNSLLKYDTRSNEQKHCLHRSFFKFFFRISNAALAIHFQFVCLFKFILVYCDVNCELFKSINRFFNEIETILRQICSQH